MSSFISPAGKFITHTVGGAIDIMTQHELRHLIQAKETWREVQSQSRDTSALRTDIHLQKSYTLVRGNPDHIVHASSGDT